ncbi:MAG: DUF3365 domain-containing protein [Planctomycetaceae bacterium]|nr:DUF3365 domain-containing protein [Planctomycetaceae bacterium]
MMNFKATLLVLSLALTPLAAGHGEEPAAGKSAASASAAAYPTVEEARRQAAGLHVTVHATLQLVHHRYYREDEGLAIPAATLKEVFAELEKDQQVKLRWLVVEGQAMNEDHRAGNAFEVEAVKALKAGKPSHELVEDGTYRRAGPITLSNACLKCHVPDRKNTKDRTAGLIVTIPLKAP